MECCVCGGRKLIGRPEGSHYRTGGTLTSPASVAVVVLMAWCAILFAIQYAIDGSVFKAILSLNLESGLCFDGPVYEFAFRSVSKSC